jgi:predicted Co/Zn/Cd cation transporter (cation efflux family)
VKPLVLAIGIAVLVALASYSLFAAIRAALTAEGYDPAVFWTAIGLFFAIAGVALWVARRLYRKHFSKPVY